MLRGKGDGFCESLIQIHQRPQQRICQRQKREQHRRRREECAMEFWMQQLVEETGGQTDRTANHIPTVESLKSSERHSETSQRQRCHHRQRGPAPADSFAHDALHDEKRQEPQRQAIESESDHHHQIAPPGPAVAQAFEVDEFCQKIGGIGKEEQPTDAHHEQRAIASSADMRRVHANGDPEGYPGEEQIPHKPGMGRISRDVPAHEKERYASQR